MEHFKIGGTLHLSDAVMKLIGHGIYVDSAINHTAAERAGADILLEAGGNATTFSANNNATNKLQQKMLYLEDFDLMEWDMHVRGKLNVDVPVRAVRKPTSVSDPRFEKASVVSQNP